MQGVISNGLLLKTADVSSMRLITMFLTQAGVTYASYVAKRTNGVSALVSYGFALSVTIKRELSMSCVSFHVGGRIETDERQHDAFPAKEQRAQRGRGAGV